MGVISHIGCTACQHRVGLHPAAGSWKLRHVDWDYSFVHRPSADNFAQVPLKDNPADLGTNTLPLETMLEFVIMTAAIFAEGRPELCSSLMNRPSPWGQSERAALDKGIYGACSSDPPIRETFSSIQAVIVLLRAAKAGRQRECQHVASRT